MVTILNNVLNRASLAEDYAEQTGHIEFNDVKAWDWFYDNVTEASTAHEYVVEDELEKWLSLKG